ncbi:putative methyltransferase-like protein 24 [Babylonia areolata]|uniref:putative methyltransferase-like protein 24 n=1 Tax=Babylonia areolata TaxID=304850 RepID=UPI003FD48E38
MKMFHSRAVVPGLAMLTLVALLLVTWTRTATWHPLVPFCAMPSCNCTMPFDARAYNKSDPLAGSAPVLETVEEQKIAARTLERLLLNDTVDQKRVCRNVQRLNIRTYCLDTGFQVAPPCLVYSFGINYDFHFDDHWGQKGCDVFSFDPSMKTPDHRRSPNVMFYKIGLGGVDTDAFVPRRNMYVTKETTWKMRTLKSLVTTLDHTNRFIDMLKIDIEVSEWEAVRHMLDSGILTQVKQFVVEWHIFPDMPPRERFQQLIKVLSDLERAGFKPMGRHAHPLDRHWELLNIQSDVSYVNTHFAKP